MAEDKKKVILDEIEDTVRTIGVLTSGGDAPGMNAAIRAVVRVALSKGLKVRGIRRGFHGLLREEIIDLSARDVSDTIQRGGTILQTARCQEMRTEEGQQKAAAICKKYGIDGLIVIGGGITGARKWIMPSLLKELRSKMHTIAGDELNRVQMKVYDLDSEEEFKEFAKGDQRTLKVYGTDRYVAYDPQKRIGVAISKLGASNAISVGAYAFALSQLDAQKA